jgi:S-adenosylmethionine:tRNA ribosyltransferase-isomerase
MSSCTREFTLSDFDFDLPESLIAQHPTAVRSASRLLDGRNLPATDRIFRELPDLLQPGDLLVFNDTKVIKARVFGEKASGGRSSCWSSACCRTTRSWPICA